MRTLVDLSEEDIKFLENLSKMKKTSRAEMIRLAISLLRKAEANSEEDAFGIWKDKKRDAIKYQKKLRSDWEES